MIIKAYTIHVYVWELPFCNARNDRFNVSFNYRPKIIDRYNEYEN